LSSDHHEKFVSNALWTSQKNANFEALVALPCPKSRHQRADGVGPLSGGLRTTMPELVTGLRINDAENWIWNHQSQRRSASLGPDGPCGSQQFLERFPLHGGDAAFVAKANFVAAKLTRDDSPTTAENLKVLLTLNADAEFEAFHGSKRIVNASHRVIATNDNDGPAQRLGCWCPGRSFESPLLLPNKFFDVDPPKSVVADDLGSIVSVSEPGSSRGAVR
jgi:hypothetical protein